MDEKITLQELAELVEFEGGLVGLFESDYGWGARLEEEVGVGIKSDLIQAEETFREFERYARRIHSALPTLENEDV